MSAKVPEQVFLRFCNRRLARCDARTLWGLRPGAVCCCCGSMSVTSSKVRARDNYERGGDGTAARRDLQFLAVWPALLVQKKHQPLYAPIGSMSEGGTFELYRQTLIGDHLCDSLEALVEGGKLTEGEDSA